MWLSVAALLVAQSANADAEGRSELSLRHTYLCSNGFNVYDFGVVDAGLDIRRMRLASGMGPQGVE